MKNIILPMSQEDLPQVLELAQELGYETDLLSLGKRLAHLSQLPHHGAFVYSFDNKILGFIHLEIVSDLIEATKVEIKALVVSQTNRGQGIGSALIVEAKKWAMANGMHTIYLSCNILRERTHSFYRREGFVLMKTSHFFEIKF